MTLPTNPFAYGGVGTTPGTGPNNTYSGSGFSGGDRMAYSFLQDDPGSSALKNSTLYDYSNPGYAFRNVLSDQGYNPYAANPFMKVLNDRVAPGLGASFERQMATTGAGASDTVNTGAYFRNYIQEMLKGQTGLGNPLNISTAGLEPGQNIQNMVQGARQVRTLEGQGVPANSINPFTLAMSERLGANGGRGTLDVLSQSFTPYMQPNMAKAYNSLLQSNYEQAVRQMANNPLDPTKDIWSYLLGY